jgi:hypothetical protein
MTQDSTEKQPRNAAPPKIHVNCQVLNINGSRQKPKENITDNFAVDLGQDRTRAGHLQLLQEESLTPGKPIRAPFDHHDLIHVRGGHRPKPDAFPEREKATVLCLWLF